MRKLGMVVAVLALLALGTTQALARTQASSSVTASAKGQVLGETTLMVTVSGKVASPNAACKANRSVRIEFVFPTPPNIKVKEKTAASGTYSGSVHLNAGADEADTATGIKVTVAKSTSGGVTCKEASKTIPLPSA